MNIVQLVCAHAYRHNVIPAYANKQRTKLDTASLSGFLSL